MCVQFWKDDFCAVLPCHLASVWRGVVARPLPAMEQVPGGRGHSGTRDAAGPCLVMLLQAHKHASRGCAALQSQG